MTHAEKIAEAQRLHAEGLSYAEIAERLGGKYKAAYRWVNDPDGAKDKARKRQYGGTCELCGARTDGSNGRAKAPKICIACFDARNETRNQRIFVDWNRGVDGEEIAAREGMTYSAVIATVDRYRREKGYALKPRRRSNRALWPLIEQLWNEGLTVVEIAARCDTTASNVSVMAAAMRDKGIDLPLRGAYDERTRSEAVRLYGSGLSCERVAARMGDVSYHTVWRWVTEAGVIRKRSARVAA